MTSLTQLMSGIFSSRHYGNDVGKRGVWMCYESIKTYITMSVIPVFVVSFVSSVSHISVFVCLSVFCRFVPVFLYYLFPAPVLYFVLLALSRYPRFVPTVSPTCFLSPHYLVCICCLSLPSFFVAFSLRLRDLCGLYCFHNASSICSWFLPSLNFSYFVFCTSYSNKAVF